MSLTPLALIGDSGGLPCARREGGGGEGHEVTTAAVGGLQDAFAKGGSAGRRLVHSGSEEQQVPVIVGKCRGIGVTLGEGPRERHGTDLILGHDSSLENDSGVASAIVVPIRNSLGICAVGAEDAGESRSLVTWRRACFGR